MQSQRKMLSSGIAARTRSANVRSAATEDAVATDRQRRHRANEGALPEAGRAHEQGANERIDDEDAPRERAPHLCRVEDQVRHDLRDEYRPEDAGGVTGARISPDTPVETERNEGEVANREYHGDGHEEDVPLVAAAAALQPQVVGDRKRGGDEREV